MTSTEGHRIRIVPSDEHIVVRHNGVVLAETRRPVLLHEGRLPTRYYIPRDDVRMDVLRSSPTKTRCPFKGEATYLSTADADDVAWSYEDPIEAAQPIRGLVCFYNEKVDITVDGEQLERPTTRWS